VSIGLVKWEPHALRWGNSAESGRGDEALELEYGGTLVAFGNGAGAARTATQIQDPSGQIAKSMGVWPEGRGGDVRSCPARTDDEGGEMSRCHGRPISGTEPGAGDARGSIVSCRGCRDSVSGLVQGSRQARNRRSSRMRPSGKPSDFNRLRGIEGDYLIWSRLRVDYLPSQK
jgi:hypothetical protein